MALFQDTRTPSVLRFLCKATRPHLSNSLQSNKDYSVVDFHETDCNYGEAPKGAEKSNFVGEQPIDAP